jgi:hypothetical protein
MNRVYPLVLISLLLGVGIGFLFASRMVDGTQAAEVQNPGPVPPVSGSDTEARMRDLESRNAELEFELDRAKQRLAASELRAAAMLETRSEVSSLLPDDAQMGQFKQQWVADALKNPGTHPMNRRFEWELQRLIQNLDLTQDQATAIGSLMDQRQEQRRVQMMVDLGLLSQAEYERMFPELLHLDYEQSLKLMLSSNQLATMESIENAERNAGLERIARNAAQRLGVHDVERFTSTESFVIEAAIRHALNQDNELTVPPAIAQLPVPPTTQRILSAAYQQLDPATFSKLYQTVLESSEQGTSPGLGMGGGRRAGAGRSGVVPGRGE